MKRTLLLVGGIAMLALVLALAPTTSAGTVINENTDQLPPGCTEIQGEEEFTVRGGVDHAMEFHGAVFAYDDRSIEVDACTLVTVTFINEDSVRHQFMVHGTYPFNPGFFLLETTDGEVTGSFITGAEPASLLIHCGVTQHQQKGMKGQLLVDGGVGDLPNLLGISGVPGQSANDADPEEAFIPLAPALSVLAALAASLLALRQRT